MGEEFTLMTVLSYPTIWGRDIVIVFLWLSPKFSGDLGILSVGSWGIVPSFAVYGEEVSRLVRLGRVFLRKCWVIFGTKWDLGSLLMPVFEWSSAPRRHEAGARWQDC